MTIPFNGLVASGKSTYSRQLADKIGWPLFSFRGFVSECAKRVGLDPEDRETLQDLGLCLSKRPELFCRAFLTWTGRPPHLVVDGLKHMQILEAMRDELGREDVKLVFVDTPDEIALSRHLSRAKDLNELSAVRAHLVESEIDFLRSEADWFLDGSTGVGLEAIVTQLVRIETAKLGGQIALISVGERLTPAQAMQTA